MNFKNLIFGTLAMSVLFSTSNKNTIAVGESINHQKVLETNNNIDYDKAINHILIGRRIMTQFAPKNSKGEPIDLDKLALELGYNHFNWVNYVEKDPHGIADTTGKLLSTPYNDPPVGGYQYDSADGFPFYWDIVKCDRTLQRYHFQNYNNRKQFKSDCVRTSPSRLLTSDYMRA